ncbi:MAG: Universal stress protein [Marmoricola sp.]|nr:Universal stress protein [Marmoricola sp.]
MNPELAPRPIVVGVDDSAGARAALRFAFDEGLKLDAPVIVVTTWLLGFARRTITTRRVHDEALEARHVQDEQISLVLDSLDGVPEFTQVVVNDVGGPTLIDVAREAMLLVVGRGRQDPLSRAFLGSVSEFCVRHSPVPVVIVPDPSRRDEASAESRTSLAESGSW